MPIVNKTKNTAAIFNRGREVVKVYDHGTLAWQKQTSIPDYLCFTALESGTFTLTIPAAVTATYLSYVEYSLDGINWTRLTVDSTAQSITAGTAQNPIPAGGKVYWRGSGACTSSRTSTQANASTFASTAEFDVSGHIMSLLKGKGFADYENLTNYNTDGIYNYTFYGLFYGNQKVVNAADLVLPTFTSYHTRIFSNLFYGCSSLVSAPLLPNLVMSEYGYSSMFRNTAIATAPALPATTLANSCYSAMFYNCVNLTSAPALPARTLVRYCYQFMFALCSSLTAAPDLLAPTLLEYCYDRMFQNCSHINHVKCLATDISATSCLNAWLNGVSSTGTFIQAEGVEWPRGASGIPTGWVDVEKRTMPSGYKQLLQVTSNGTAYIQLSFGFEETDEVAAAFSVDNTQGNDKYIVSSQTWNSNNNRYGLGQHLANHYYTPAFGGLSTGQTCLTPLTANNGELHNWTYASRLFTLVDLSLSKDVSSITFGGVTTNLRLFYGMAPNNTKGAISSYKHIKGSTTACDFVAAVRESDNTAGLYDLANDEFMTCNGLTAGEEI